MNVKYWKMLVYVFKLCVRVDGGGKVCGGGSSSDDPEYLYEGQDWVISPEETSAISPLLAEETFRYMSESFSACKDIVWLSEVREFITLCSEWYILVHG